MPEHHYFVDETALVTPEEWDNLRAQRVIGWDAAGPPPDDVTVGRTGVPPHPRRTMVLAGRRGGRATAARSAAAAALPALGQLMREAAQHEQDFVDFRRRVIALGIDPALADQAYEEAMAASQESPRPFHIADAEARLRRLVGPADVPADFVQRLGEPGPWRHWTEPNSDPRTDLVEYCRQVREAMPPPPLYVQEPTHHDSYTMDGVEQQIVEDAHRAYAAHLERRERALRVAYGIPDEATTAEAIRIIRQHGRRRGESLHAPERAMDIPGPPDENGERTVLHFTTSFSVPMLTPEEARAAAERYLAGRSGSWVRGAAPLCHCGHHPVSHTDGVGCDVCGVAACPGYREDRLHEVRAGLREDAESHFDAINRLTAPVVDDGYRYGSDQAAFDTKPDHCWRCCAVKAENDLGTCDPCREDLRS